MNILGSFNGVKNNSDNLNITNNNLNDNFNNNINNNVNNKSNNNPNNNINNDLNNNFNNLNAININSTIVFDGISSTSLNNELNNLNNDKDINDLNAIIGSSNCEKVDNTNAETATISNISNIDNYDNINNNTCNNINNITNNNNSVTNNINNVTNNINSVTNNINNLSINNFNATGNVNIAIENININNNNNINNCGLTNNTNGIVNSGINNTTTIHYWRGMIFCGNGRQLLSDDAQLISNQQQPKQQHLQQLHQPQQQLQQNQQQPQQYPRHQIQQKQQQEQQQQQHQQQPQQQLHSNAGFTGFISNDTSINLTDDAIPFHRLFQQLAIQQQQLQQQQQNNQQQHLSQQQHQQTQSIYQYNTNNINNGNNISELASHLKSSTTSSSSSSSSHQPPNPFPSHLAIKNAPESDNFLNSQHRVCHPSNETKPSPQIIGSRKRKNFVPFKSPSKVGDDFKGARIKMKYVRKEGGRWDFVTEPVFCNLKVAPTKQPTISHQHRKRNHSPTMTSSTPPASYNVRHAQQHQLYQQSSSSTGQSSSSSSSSTSLKKSTSVSWLQPRRPGPPPYRCSYDSQSESDPNENQVTCPEYYTPPTRVARFWKSSYCGKECASCGVRKTPLWRDAEDGTPLCNACGIRYKKYRIRCSHCWNIPRRSLRPYWKCFRCDRLM